MSERENVDRLLLNEFLQSIEKVPIQVVEALLQVTENEDEKNVINAFAPALTNQFRELSLAGFDRMGRVSPQKLNEAENFLKVSSGNLLTQNLKIALPSIGSFVGKLGIAGIIEEIKKIIKEIMRILGIKLGEKILAIINLIDEIFKHMFGGESMKLRNALSQMEQNYLAELTQLAKLEKASQFQFQDDDEDED